MGQSEIIKFLEKEPNKWFSMRDILNGTETLQSSTGRALKQLRKCGEVFWRMEGIVFYYKSKKTQQINVNSVTPRDKENLMRGRIVTRK